MFTFYAQNELISNELPATDLKIFGARHDGASGPCSHMAFFVHDKALVGICRWYGGFCLLTVVSGSIPGPI